ncbi:MAG TPA: Dabb family protein [Candidatus Acidoferrales bacterium]|nr:Dabb family protein [Candidatus Acidoferrales bacterium]
MTRNLRTPFFALLAAAFFFAGYAAGQNQFGQPRTVLQVSLIKFNPGVSDADGQKVIDGVKKMAAQIPGIKNIWLKADRMEPRDFDAAIVIEFVNRAAADRYAESPIHESWSRQLQQIRLTSISPQITNP